MNLFVKAVKCEIVALMNAKVECEVMLQIQLTVSGNAIGVSHR